MECSEAGIVLCHFEIYAVFSRFDRESGVFSLDPWSAAERISVPPFLDRKYFSCFPALIGKYKSPLQGANQGMLLPRLVCLINAFSRSAFYVGVVKEG